MSVPTWGDLQKYYCGTPRIQTGINVSSWGENPLYEDFATRRYNYSAMDDNQCFRLIFLKDVLKNPAYNTLQRKGRFIWCKNLCYEGKDLGGYRQISFTVDDGKKRFQVAENNILCLPSKSYVNNTPYFRPKNKTFLPFSTVFCYHPAVRELCFSKTGGYSTVIKEKITNDSPYKPGTLVAPRLGYFYPERNVTQKDAEEHPYGVILAPSHSPQDYFGKEFYRVRFGDTIYERIHPVQMEIINEV